MIKKITSRQNNLILDIKKLKVKKNRKNSGLFIVEGYKNVIDSIKLDTPEYVFITGNFSEFYNALFPVYKVPDKIFSDISDTKTPQGILAVFKIPPSGKLGDKIILLNGVSDPGNVGTIFRTSLATGFDTVVLDKNCADAFSPKVVRSAMSAVFSLNIIRVENLEEFLKNYPEFTYYASALSKNSKNLYDLKFAQKTAVILGSEANGIEKSVLDKSNVIYKIPMDERIESLNVAVAASITEYEVLRQTNTLFKQDTLQ